MSGISGRVCSIFKDDGSCSTRRVPVAPPVTAFYPTPLRLFFSSAICLPAMNATFAFDHAISSSDPLFHLLPLLACGV